MELLGVKRDYHNFTLRNIEQLSYVFFKIFKRLWKGEAIEKRGRGGKKEKWG